MPGRSRFGVVVVGALLALALPAAVAGGAGGALHASAELKDVAGDVVGWARFTEDANGILHVNVHVRGLTPGLHGTHIHAVGSCTPDFGAAGSHHNPRAAVHGAHAGDLPNLAVNTAGVGHLDAKSDRATLSPGLVSVFDSSGSALIIHAASDDLTTDPTGNSGGRVACGIIVPG